MPVLGNHHKLQIFAFHGEASCTVHYLNMAETKIQEAASLPKQPMGNTAS